MKDETTKDQSVDKRMRKAGKANGVTVADGTVLWTGTESNRQHKEAQLSANNLYHQSLIKISSFK
jgi:hypothetical protein